MLEWSGGSFRNFFTRYPEAQAMQQKMLRVSQQVNAYAMDHITHPGKKRVVMVDGQRLTVQEAMRAATQALYTGQCNCAYWHGVFGGLYLSHLRRAVYAQLITAQRLANQLAGETVSLTAVDTDGDSREEACVTTPTLNLVVDPDEDGTVTEWSVFQPPINLLDTLSRRPEPYHEQLTRKPVRTAVTAGGAAPASIHEALGIKEDHLASHLIYDDHRRSAFVDYALQSAPTLQEIVRSSWAERRLWSTGPFRWDRTARKTTVGSGALSVSMVRELDGGSISKTVRIAPDRPVVEYRYQIEQLRIPMVALEFNLSLRDERYLTDAQEHLQSTSFQVHDAPTGLWLHLAIDPPARLIHFPLETISESEEGLERTYQGLCVMCLWSLDETDEHASTWSSRLEWTVQSAPIDPRPRATARHAKGRGR